jgi:hypothetical protein
VAERIRRAIATKAKDFGLYELFIFFSPKKCLVKLEL